MLYSPNIVSPSTVLGRTFVWPALLIAAVLAGTILGYWLASEPDRTPVASVVMEEGCDLHAGACLAQFHDDAKVSLSITPKEIPVFQPLQLEVEVEGLEADAVVIDFAGVDMDMGPNHLRLESRGDGRFEGEGILPACIRDRMTWQATVSVETDVGWHDAVFRFDTFRGR